MSAVEAYQARVRALGCVVCWHLYGKDFRVGPCSLHHPESDRDELSEWMVIPICYEHHQGVTGIHGLSRRGFERVYKLTEMDLMGMVNKRMAQPEGMYA